MPDKSTRTRFTFFIYWFLLFYIIAALIFWFISLHRQNETMYQFKLERIQNHDPSFHQKLIEIEEEKKRKDLQYAGEGAIFLLVIIAGAVFLYRSVQKQLQLSLQQQNFMISVTHELKTPVAIAKLNLETIQKRKLEETQHQKLLQNTIQEINRLDSLCNNMLVSSQIEAGGYRMVREEINLSETLSQIVDNFKARYVTRIISSDIQESMYVHADKILLEIVVSNLLENAMKYSVKTEELLIKAYTGKKQCIIECIDKGPGIPKAEQKKIFKKFYRLGNEATKTSKGTGLGLYLAWKIIKAHKGSIFVKDNSAGGSTFTITLPQA